MRTTNRSHGRPVSFCRFTSDVIKSRWFMVFASFLIMSGSGATYLFGTYSQAIKTTQGYDQTTINLLGFFKDFGASIGLFSGLVAELTPPWFVLLLGAVMNFSGFFVIWLSVTNKIPKPKIWQMCLYICIGSNSQNVANTGALVPCVKNCPESRGVILGLLKGYVGLSGAILTQLYLAIYGENSKSLILLIAWLPAAISLVFVNTIRTMEIVRQPNELKIFYQFLYASISLALFLMVMIVVQKHFAFSHAAYICSATAVCVFLFSPMFIAIKEEFLLWNLKNTPENPTIDQVAIEKPETVESERAEEPAKAPVWANICNKPERGEDYSILQALLSIDMLIMIFCSFSGLGASLTAVDNLGQIGLSQGYQQDTVRAFVSLVSIWNYFGRVFAGFVSEILLHKHKFPRPLMLSLVLFLSCIGHLLIALPFRGSVYVASVVIGFSFGAQLPLNNAIISELFGLKHFAMLFNICALTNPLGSFILNVKVTGFLYDREAKEQLKRNGKELVKGKPLICNGNECYRLSFIILAFVTFLGAIVSLILVMRTRKFYRSDLYKKFREDGTSGEAKLDSSSVQEKNDEQIK